MISGPPFWQTFFCALALILIIVVFGGLMWLLAYMINAAAIYIGINAGIAEGLSMLIPVIIGAALILASMER